MTMDAIIIGGGLIGSSTALHLALKGQRVMVIEKDSPGRHASGVNAGGLRRLNRHPAEIPLAVAAAEMWREIRALVGSDCDVQLSGQVKVAENEADLQKLADRAALVQSLGFAHEQLIDRDRLYQLVPTLAPHCVGGLYTEGDGFARPYHALTAFRHKAQSLGVQYQTGCRVTGFDLVGDCWRVVTERSQTEPANFDAPVLVNCAGAWAEKLCTDLGEPVPLRVGAPMMMVTERLPHFLDPVVGAASRKLSFKQMQNGTVLIGGAHLADHDWEQETTAIDFTKLSESSHTALDLFPRMADVRIVRIWAGLEAFMPDQIPVIGPSAKAPNVYHAFGFSAHGFQLSPVVGRILSELILEDKSSLAIEPFSIKRFQP
ncbi:Hydrogen cyanide synthase subunit HcnC [Acaryochloris thomasi RCC1774]|uniref:Hydrogen cyanide synthase subunit HcnC n=1 Tax=Acaryochloris thomasi RCC1774 TaxID=1764569 RepID=A0A2W1JLV2_9CYAN|nr:FAD-dependent oxidoreductase [Acaryochloris thomasi]PZD71154.1 Hydrogen cyanide synthase subunit HcnC [Acaryochloris thomasi RCC1774]